MSWVTMFAADITPFLTDCSAYRKAYRLVSVERQSKANQYRFEKDRCLCVGAEVLLIHACDEMKFDFSRHTILVDENGKPDFADGNLHFNLSHSGNVVFCALSDRTVGCDTEQLRPFDTHIANRFFAKEESSYLDGIPDENQRLDRFFRLWTLKESFIKCTGLGLKMPLRQFTVDISRGEPRLTEQPEQGVYVMGEEKSRGYRFAWCVRCQDGDDQFSQSQLRWLNLTT